MSILRAVCLASLLSIGCSTAHAWDISLDPKYGLVTKDEAQLAADAKFLEGIDEYYKGNRNQASQYYAVRGWQLLRQDKPQDAMRRFNQAWLLDNKNGNAIWGMAAQQGMSNHQAKSLELFAEAEKLIGNDIDFAVDYAKTLGQAGAENHDENMLNDAFARFAALYASNPDHTLNLQNWAITLFYVGNYAEAWKKIKLAERTPHRGAIDRGFVSELQSKMPRP